MKNSKIILVLSCVFAILNCTPHYLSYNFISKAADHKIIAVLPFEMLYTGVQPKGITDEDIYAIEEAESQAFQISFYNEILRSTKSGQKPIRVSIQHYKKNMRILEDNDYDVHSSWQETAEVLASILNADGIITASIQKNRLMTELDSYDVEVAVHILDELVQPHIWPFLPGNVSTSKEIYAIYSLMNQKDGEVLWSVSFNIDADWRQESHQIIDNLNRKAAKKFPNRLK